ncbi:ImmA/IrrE family metallo-endopeptidase [Thermanaerosceptrum fracticalcis]|uniref:ImmA/IrrE family metallo-endopeptidase n=1 Tax=Thermanaerosceptrum fracticalcis TaxID=1712410 RepID=A0A7G6E1C4_THEFR|nr:ImmA/IrrE family metallo-endopeptidase [Thermanaerosceptrum fracticalcis]QNB45878.1 ImmA/IrrE family metallo-endopeptidase [Thermanaerosceptrum fracticalcis]
MNIAIKKALEVLELHGLLDSYIDFQQLSTILDKENIIFYTFPFQGRLKERYIATNDEITQIAVKESIDIAQEKHMIAHALGHHFLHRGNYAHIDGIVQDKQENQAEDFAAVLLVPPSILKKFRPTWSFQIAEECNIPLSLAERRIRILEAIGI